MASSFPTDGSPSTTDGVPSSSSDSAQPTATLSPTQLAKRERDRVEYYAETKFKNVDLSRQVHLGWGVAGGTALIVFCMAMSGLTQARSWNVSFLWLQRRVGAQFLTLTYMITDNMLHYFDGDKWVTRDWDKVLTRYSVKAKQPAAHSFASSAAQQ